MMKCRYKKYFSGLIGGFGAEGRTRILHLID